MIFARWSDQALVTALKECLECSLEVCHYQGTLHWQKPADRFTLITNYTLLTILIYEYIKLQSLLHDRRSHIKLKTDAYNPLDHL